MVFPLKEAQAVELIWWPYSSESSGEAACHSSVQGSREGQGHSYQVVEEEREVPGTSLAAPNDISLGETQRWHPLTGVRVSSKPQRKELGQFFGCSGRSPPVPSRCFWACCGQTQRPPAAAELLRGASCKVGQKICKKRELSSLFLLLNHHR